MTLLEIASEQALAADFNYRSTKVAGTMADAKEARKDRDISLARLKTETDRLLGDHHVLGTCLHCGACCGKDVGGYYHRLACEAHYIEKWLQHCPGDRKTRKALETALEFARNTGD